MRRYEKIPPQTLWKKIMSSIKPPLTQEERWEIINAETKVHLRGEYTTVAEYYKEIHRELTNNSLKQRFGEALASFEIS